MKNNSFYSMKVGQEFLNKNSSDAENNAVAHSAGDSTNKIDMYNSEIGKEFLEKENQTEVAGGTPTEAEDLV